MTQEDQDSDIENWFRHNTRDGLTSRDHIEIFTSLDLRTQSIIDAIAAPMLALYNEADIALLTQTHRQTKSEFVRDKVLGAITAISKYSTISTARQQATDFLNQLDQPTLENEDSPVHAFATLFLHRTEQALRGETDVEFLKSTFNKLLLNFNWWVNRKDRFGKNVFEGGFLGLDNIGIFDRSAPLPTGGHLEQADGTAWMALFSQNMLELAFELTAHDPTYEAMVVKFVEHFSFI